MLGEPPSRGLRVRMEPLSGPVEGNPQMNFSPPESLNTFGSFEYRPVGIEALSMGAANSAVNMVNPSNEMIGYQAANQGLFGSLYDESRRRHMLVQADSDLIDQLENRANGISEVMKGRVVCF